MTRRAATARRAMRSRNFGQASSSQQDELGGPATQDWLALLATVNVFGAGALVFYED